MQTLFILGFLATIDRRSDAFIPGPIRQDRRCREHTHSIFFPGGVNKRRTAVL